MTDTRKDDGTLLAAVQLGWRVAELYSLADDVGDPSDDDLLPSHASLAEADQLELQLHAAAGDARRAGVTSEAGSLEEENLRRLAREAPTSDEARQRKQLDDWGRAVAARLQACDLPDEAKVREGLRRQTILAATDRGDKEPEAYLDRDARAELRDELRALAWRHSRRWIVPLAGLLVLLLVAAPWLAELYDAGLVKTGLASAVVALAAAARITKASVVLTVRGHLENWAQLLWNRSVAYKGADRTSALSHVWEPDVAGSAGASVSASDDTRGFAASQPRPSPCAEMRRGRQIGPP
jgi:hypothetical protein